MVKRLEVQIAEIGEWLGTGSINIFGVPFAGKDTQGDKLADALGAKLLGGGDILRSAKISDRVRRIMNSGQLIPTPDYVDIVVPHLSRPELAKVPLVLSAVGRMLGEEQGVLAATEQAGHPIRVVPFLDIDPEIAFERLAAVDRGREDDTPEILMERFDAFQNSTLGVIDTYERMGLVVTIDAGGSEQDVYTETVQAIHRFAESN